MDTLLIRVYPSSTIDEPPTAEWLIVGVNRRTTGEAGYGTLEEAAQAAPYRRTVVLVPSENILLIKVNIKARNREQLARAIPYALEEDLAENVEELHFAPGPRQPDGSHPVAVVAQAHIAQWLTQLQAAGLMANVLVPDVLGLPLAPDNAWSLLLEKDRGLLRTCAYSGLTLEPANLEAFFNCTWEEAAYQPDLIEVYDCAHTAEWRLPSIASTNYEQREGCPPHLWAAGLDEKRTINLLQGQYRIKSDIGRILKPWRAAAALLGVWIALQAAEIGLDYRRLSAQERALQTKIEQIYRATFPNATRVVNPRVQMEQQLQALRRTGQRGTQTAFESLLYTAAQAIRGLPGVNIEMLNYTDGRLELSLRARELRSVEAIKQRVEREGLSADIESAETSGANVSGVLVVQGARG